VTQVLRLELIEADDTAAKELQLAPGAAVWALDRLRLVGDRPLAVMSNILPATIIDLSDVDLSRIGLYEQLRRAGIHIRVAHQRIGAVRADSSSAKLLGSRKGDPLLTMQRTAYDDGGRAVELGSHVYRPDLYAFEMTLVDK
jgi:DNA-binding GntR family transcriptional regulator